MVCGFMAYIIISERSGHKAHYIQFFDGDTKFPIGNRLADEIRSSYKLKKTEDHAKEKNEDIKLEMEGVDPLLSIDVSGGEEKYVLRFSKDGKGITIDPDFVYYLQSTCRLELETEGDRKGVKLYSIKPKGTSCIKSENA